MPYQVDFWGGDMHTEEAGTLEFAGWAAAAEAMRTAVDAGLLCNVLHTDFKAPPGAAEAAMRKLLREGDHD
jgi:ribosomal protein S11